MKTLTDIANGYELDKGTLPAEQCSWFAKHPDHTTLGYTKVYEKYMDPHRLSTKKFLEIGVADPRFPLKSIDMWHEYFARAGIYGIDSFWGNEPSRLFVEKSYTPRVYLGIGDQGSRQYMNGFIRSTNDIPFDFIVEDGCHWPSHIMISLACCFPHLRSGGTYFIEDLQNPAFAGHASFDNVQITESLTNFQRTGELKRLYITREEHAMLLGSIACIDLTACGQSVLAAITKN